MANIPIDIYPNTPTDGNPAKLPDLSSSNSDTENEGDENMDVLQVVACSTEERKMSPPPNCAICLGRCKNKCFTDSCVHQFCFKCLCEWSKVKPECPLCKQTFKSIIHNVKSEDQFERYHVEPPTVQIPHRPLEDPFEQLPYIGDDIANGSRREYDVAIANSNGLRAHNQPLQSHHHHGGAIPSGPNNNNNNNNNADNDNVGGEMLQISGANTHSVFYGREFGRLFQREHPDAPLNVELRTMYLRRYLYNRKFYALPVRDITGNFRDCSARFYRNNPAQIHRLMPFINRDIMCLLRNTEQDVTNVVNMIKDSLLLMNILSPSFRRRMQPILGNRTAHFIHELYNFARSPYDMIGYDHTVQYSAHVGDDIVIGSASSEDDNVSIIQIILDESGNHIPQTSRHATDYRLQSQSSSNSRNAEAAPVSNTMMTYAINTIADDTEVSGFSMVDNTNGNREIQPAAINLSTHNRRDDDPIIILDEIDGDVLVVETEELPPVAAINVTENIELTSGSSDECEFVLERKPPHLRTPDMISLNSETDSDVVFVNEVQLHPSVPKTSGNDDDAADRNEAKDTKPLQSMAIGTKPKQNTAVSSETFNMEGASTSAGIQSDERHRWQITTRSGKHMAMYRRLFPSSPSKSNNKRMKLIGRSTATPTATTSSCTTSDSDASSTTCTCSSDNEQAKGGEIKIRAKDRRYWKRPNKRHKIVSNNQHKDTNRRRKPANTSRWSNSSSSSSDTSDEDECLNLKILRSKLKMESQEINVKQDEEHLMHTATDNSSSEMRNIVDELQPTTITSHYVASFSSCQQSVDDTEAAAFRTATVSNAHDDDDDSNLNVTEEQQYDQPEQNLANNESTIPLSPRAIEVTETTETSGTVPNSGLLLLESTIEGDASSSSNHGYEELDHTHLPLPSSHSSSSAYTMYSATSLSTNASVSSPIRSHLVATDADEGTVSNDFNNILDNATSSQYNEQHLDSCISPLASDSPEISPSHPS